MSLERVDPDDRIRLPREPRHLVSDDRRLLALPAVGCDHDDRAARERAASPLVVEALQGRADPGATGPVADTGGRIAQRGLRVAALEIRRQPGQARAKGERLDAAPRAHQRVEKEHERAGVGLHRAGDVAEHDELARDLNATAERPLDRLAAGAERSAHEPAHVEVPPAVMRTQAPGAPARTPRRDLRNEPPDVVELGASEVGEVALTEELLGAVADRRLPASVRALVS